MARAKKRADGRYCSQIYLGRDENGKRKYKSVYAKTPAELKEKETSVRLQLGQGLDVLSQRDSFATWADDWLRLKEKEQITCRQMDNYRRAVKLWKEELPGYEIGQVRADDVERVLIALSDQGLAQRTVDLYASGRRPCHSNESGRAGRACRRWPKSGAAPRSDRRGTTMDMEHASPCAACSGHYDALGPAPRGAGRADME